MADIPICSGSGSAISGSTPFGQYDTDSSFQSDVKCSKLVQKDLDIL